MFLPSVYPTEHTVAHYQNSTAFILFHLDYTFHASTAIKSGGYFSANTSLDVTLVCLSSSQDDAQFSKESPSQSTHTDFCELILSATSSQKDSS